MEFQMRNKTFISSMVGIAAAVVVAGSANAGIAPLATGKIDGFTGNTFTGYTGIGTGNSVEGPYANGTLGFNYRSVGTTGDSKGTTNTLVTTANVNSVTGGNQVQALVKSGSTRTTSALTDMYANWLWANAAGFDSNGTATSLNSFDMSNASSFTVSFADNTFGTTGFSGTNLRIEIQLFSNVNSDDFWSAQQTVTSSGGTLTFNAADFGAGAAANWTDLGGVWLYVSYDVPAGLSAGTNLGNVTLTDFSYNAVPAPGALALLGAAGIVGARRRRA
jgi:hypothetical protein